MTAYGIHLTRYVHTCRSDPLPHTIEVRRRILWSIPGGPCLQPISITIGGTTAVLPCGRLRAPDAQCGACSVEIVEHDNTIINLDQHAPETAPECPSGAAT